MTVILKTQRKRRGSPDTHDLPVEWKTVKLGDIVSIKETQ